LIRRTLLAVYEFIYERVARPLIFRSTPEQAHDHMMRLLRWIDERAWVLTPLKWINALAFDEHPAEVGGVKLPHPLILAAGFVKGEGFDREDEAMQAVGRNIIPGWRSLPLLVGAVEFGSFTRHPRLGNSGTVLWRDESSHSTQNRVGLKNPGACAAAEFLAQRRSLLPRVFGINIAISPGVTDQEQMCCEVLEAVAAFITRNVLPSWFTLNLSCPNTEDDPGSRQTEAQARDLCAAVTENLRPYSIPLWVKISPALAAEQYRTLLRVFAETSVRAVIATNTLASPAPDGMTAGIGGGKLHQHALEVVALLNEEKMREGFKVDIIACGGVENGQTYHDFARRGAVAMQYWSALVYRGPLAAALIECEAHQEHKA
jgi:dihydroorotate dehydrogenase